MALLLLSMVRRDCLMLCVTMYSRGNTMECRDWGDQLASRKLNDGRHFRGKNQHRFYIGSDHAFVTGKGRD